jgi:hypothetical protein
MFCVRKIKPCLILFTKSTYKKQYIHNIKYSLNKNVSKVELLHLLKPQNFQNYTFFSLID